MHVYDPAHDKVHVHLTGRDGSVRRPGFRPITDPTRTPPAARAGGQGDPGIEGSREMAAR